MVMQIVMFIEFVMVMETVMFIEFVIFLELVFLQFVIDIYDSLML